MGEDIVEELRVQLARHEEQIRGAVEKIEEIKKNIQTTQDLAVAVKELAVETKYMREELNDTARRVSKMEDEDSEEWRKFKWILITAVVGIVLGFVALKLGLK